MKKIHGKMMKGITTKSLMMLLTLAGSSYCHAQQATIVVSNDFRITHRAYLSEHE